MITNIMKIDNEIGWLKETYGHRKITKGEVEDVARLLLSKYVPEFKFRWNKLVRCYGLCHHHGVIEISEVYFNYAETWQVLDTLLHELAHAIVGVGVGHGYKWKCICRQLGAIPQRCSKHVDMQLRYAAITEKGDTLFTRNNWSECMVDKEWTDRKTKQRIRWFDTKESCFVDSQLHSKNKKFA